MNLLLLYSKVRTRETKYLRELRGREGPETVFGNRHLHGYRYIKQKVMRSWLVPHSFPAGSDTILLTLWSRGSPRWVVRERERKGRKTDGTRVRGEKKHDNAREYKRSASESEKKENRGWRRRPQENLSDVSMSAWTNRQQAGCRYPVALKLEEYVCVVDLVAEKKAQIPIYAVSQSRDQKSQLQKEHINVDY